MKIELKEKIVILLVTVTFIAFLAAAFIRDNTWIYDNSLGILLFFEILDGLKMFIPFVPPKTNSFLLVLKCDQRLN